MIVRQWMKACTLARLSDAVQNLLASLITMGIKFNFVIHQNLCNGDCSTCQLDMNDMQGIYPVKTIIQTTHVNNVPTKPDWNHVAEQYRIIFGFESYPVSLPSNYREILRKPDYEYHMKTFLSNNCNAVLNETNKKVADFDAETANLRSRIQAKASEQCSSNKMKKHCTRESRNVTYKCGRYCRTEILGVCVDYASNYCNKVEDFANCSDIADVDAQAVEIKSCEQAKQQAINALEQGLLKQQGYKQQELQDKRYSECMDIMKIN